MRLLNKNFFLAILLLAPVCSVSFAVNCDIKCKQDLQKILDDYRVKYQIPALAMTISLSASQPVLDFYSGTTTKNGNVKIDSNSIFEIGSITKEFTASIILQLEAEGKLSINDTVGKWLPEYSAWKDVTLKQLMNMTGGITDYESDDAFLQKIHDYPESYWQMSEIVDWAYNLSPNTDFAPGANWNYSNTHYTMLGEIIEKVTNETVAQNMQERIIRPIGLQNTFYDNKLIPIKLPNFVHGYDDREDACSGMDDADISISEQNTQGGLFSTANSLNKWIRTLFSGKFLPQQQFQEMTSVVCINDPSQTCKPGETLPPVSDQWGYNSGLFHNSNYSPYGDLWWLNGETIGHQAAFFYLKDLDFVVTFAGGANNAMLDSDLFGGYAELLAEVYDYFYAAKNTKNK